MEERVAATAKYNAKFAMDLMRRAAELVGETKELPEDGTLIDEAFCRAWDEMQQGETTRRRKLRTYGRGHLASDLRSYVLLNEDANPRLADCPSRSGRKSTARSPWRPNSGRRPRSSQRWPRREQLPSAGSESCTQEGTGRTFPDESDRGFSEGTRAWKLK